MKNDNETHAHTETETTLNVIDSDIHGTREDDSNLYLILWERIANNGLIYAWGKSEEEVYKNYSYKLNPYVRHTIVKIDPLSMPVTDGRKAQ